jgi:hypothetical protein
VASAPPNAAELAAREGEQICKTSTTSVGVDDFSPAQFKQTICRNQNGDWLPRENVARSEAQPANARDCPAGEVPIDAGISSPLRSGQTVCRDASGEWKPAGNILTKTAG